MPFRDLGFSMGLLGLRGSRLNVWRFFLNAFHPSWGRLLPPKTATPTPVGFGFRVYIPPASRVQIPARDMRSLFSGYVSYSR